MGPPVPREPALGDPPLQTDTTVSHKSRFLQVTVSEEGPQCVAAAGRHGDHEHFQRAAGRVRGGGSAGTALGVRVEQLQGGDAGWHLCRQRLWLSRAGKLLNTLRWQSCISTVLRTEISKTRVRKLRC